MFRKLWIALFGFVLLCSCSRTSQPPTNLSNTNKAAGGGGGSREMKISSTVFQDNGSIPSKYTCDGANVSPPLEWSGIPSNAKAIALIVDDPDAPAKTWVHWVAYDLPVSSTQLAEDVKPTQTIPSGGTNGTNDFKKLGYGGPCPPSGTHRYFFKIYALDTPTLLKPGATKDELLRAMEGHILTQGELMGKYQRK